MFSFLSHSKSHGSQLFQNKLLVTFSLLFFFHLHNRKKAIDANFGNITTYGPKIEKARRNDARRRIQVLTVSTAASPVISQVTKLMLMLVDIAASKVGRNRPNLTSTDDI